MPAKRKPLTAVHIETVSYDDIPNPEKEDPQKPANPLYETVQALYDSMPVGPSGEPSDRSAGVVRMVVPDQDVDRHLRWAWNAGDLMAHPVSVRHHRIPDEDTRGMTRIWLWTVPKIRRSR